MRFFGRLQKPHTHLCYTCFIIASLCCMYSISSDSSTREELRDGKKKRERKEEALPIYQAIHKSADLETHQDG
ncbi:hypothetical protein BDV35DRAFT_183210 [Aspergillus flavus]|uniref:Uncharacterized protein n=1 Tax=Aspergillus flavus TaxID=5059 RepID=A0A5N6H3S7_ASPFL|nr:hypothetical protein BDV35DRAFT_183210 [Aspergillus flavus]